MNRCKWAIVWLLGALAVCCAAPAAATDKLMLAGGGDRLWLVRTGEDATSFDVLTYRAGEKWRWVKRGIGGRPTAIAAGGGQLHVLTGPKAAYLIVHTDSSRAPAISATPPRDIWPADTAPLAACTALDFVGEKGWSFVVVAGRVRPASTEDDQPLTDRPAEVPPPADALPEDSPQPVDLPQPVAEEPAVPAVLQHAGGQWRRLTDLPVALADGARVHVVVVAGELMMLVDSPRGDNSLWAWRPPDDVAADEQWARVDLTGNAASAAAVAMFPARGEQLTLVVAVPAEQDGGERLEIVSLRPAGEATAPQPITLDGEPVVLPAVPLAAPLTVSQDLHRVALMWRQDATVKFTLCDVDNGVADPAGDLAALTEAPLDQSGKDVLNYFLVVLVVVTFAVMIGSRPKTAPGPMILSASCRPAPLAKRALSGLIDLIPISILVSFVVPMPELPVEAIGDFREFWDRYSRLVLTRQASYSLIVTLCTYMVYGIVMEARFAATLGKMALKMRVVGADGRPPGPRAVVLRNVVKMLEVCMPWLLVIVPLLNPARQRLGDILARTVVIEDAQRSRLPGDEPQPPATDEPPGRPPDDEPGDS